MAVDAAGRTLFAAGPWGDVVAVVPLDNPHDRRTVALDKGSYPYAVLPDPKSDRLFVSLWGSAAVAVIDPVQAKVVGTWPTESHPTEMALSPDGKTLFVACANSSKVSVLDASHDGKSLETLRCSLYPDAPSGNTPNSLALTPDGRMLFVANADASNLAVFNVAAPGHSESLGFIPTGWYPTSVCYNPIDQRLYVAEGKGLSSRANPHGPGPYEAKGLGSTYQYIAGLLQGDMSFIDLPGPDQLADYTKQAYACSPLRADRRRSATWPDDSPIPHKLGGDSPIKHCIYIIKENRTYDQVLGDMKEGNGDADLCLFGEKITPNYHKLARQFVLLDNFYVDGEVSADGHQWSMGAYATDFVEKVWPLNYRGSPLRKLALYPSEGNYDPIARPAGGYIWDRCAEAKVSYRSYGEFVDNGKKAGDPAVPRSQGAGGTHRPRLPRLGPRLPRRETGGALHRRAASIREERRHAASQYPASAERPHDRHEGRQADATGDGRRQRPGPGHGGGGGQQEQPLEGHGDLRAGGRRSERPRSRGRPPLSSAGRQRLHQAQHGGFDDVFDEQHIADDGIDPGAETDEPVRRGRPADGERFSGQGGPDAV